MVGILDVAPSTAKTVYVEGYGDIAVKGISARGVAMLLREFPDLHKLMAGQEVKLDFTHLLELVPDAIAAIIAAGWGHPGDEKALSIADDLPLDNQADLISEIIARTMPKGVVPFMEKVEGLMSKLDVSAKTPAMKSRQQLKSA